MAESLEVKARLVAIAMEVFAEHGYAQTTLNEIGKRVGISRPGVLHHFPSKESLFAAVLERLHEWADQQMKDGGTRAGLDGLRDLGVFLGTSEGREPLRLIHVLHGEAMAGNGTALEYCRMRQEAIHQHIRDQLEMAWAGGELSGKVNLEAAAALIASTIYGLQAQWLLGRDSGLEAAFALLMDGVIRELWQEG